jgi:hypothetical protein
MDNGQAYFSFFDANWQGNLTKGEKVPDTFSAWRGGGVTQTLL